MDWDQSYFRAVEPAQCQSLAKDLERRGVSGG
jgi:hypothetical protein